MQVCVCLFVLALSAHNFACMGVCAWVYVCVCEYVCVYVCVNMCVEEMVGCKQEVKGSPLKPMWATTTTTTRTEEAAEIAIYSPSYIQFNMLYMSTLNLKPIGATVTMSLGLLADCYIAI